MDTPDFIVERVGLQHHCPTIAWGIVADGRVVASGGFRHPDAPRWIASPAANTTYRIASMTKSFSAAATLALRDEGAFGLDDEIEKFAPELGRIGAATTDAAPVTIRHLLTMMSGLVTDDPWADRHLDLSDVEFDAIVDRGVVAAVPVGQRYEYSNFGFAVLGRVIERATGTRLQDHVTQRFLVPLGMSGTGWHPPTPGAVDWQRPLRWSEDGGFAEELPPLGDGLIAPMGGLWSTVSDVAVWIGFLDDAFPARDGEDPSPLRRSSRREMQTPQIYIGRGNMRGVANSTSYGLGLRIVDEDQPAGAHPLRVVNHSGGFPGYGSNMRWMPGRGLGVVALSNLTYAPMALVTALLLDYARNEYGGDPQPIPPAARRDERSLRQLAVDFVELCNDWSDERARAIFADNVELDLDLRRRNDELDNRRPFVIEAIDIVDGGHIRIACTTSIIEIIVAPPRPHRIQTYTVSEPS